MHPCGDALYAKQMQALPARGAFGAAAPIGAAARVWALTGRRARPLRLSGRTARAGPAAASSGRAAFFVELFPKNG